MHECSQHLLCFYMKVKVLVTQSFCNSLRPHGLSMEFSKQKYWSGLPFPSPGALPDPGNEPGSPALQADFLPSELPFHILTMKSGFFLIKTINGMPVGSHWIIFCFISSGV